MEFEPLGVGHRIQTGAVMSLLKASCLNLFFYALDMATAVAGFYFGFGLQVQNWPALIGFMIISRWIVYVGKGVYNLHMEKKSS